MFVSAAGSTWRGATMKQWLGMLIFPAEFICASEDGFKWFFANRRAAAGAKMAVLMLLVGVSKFLISSRVTSGERR